MKILLLIFSFAIFTSILGESLLTKNQETLWENFKMDFHKIYTMAEDQSRKSIFFENVNSIEKFNQEGHSYEQGINQFTDMREDEIPTGFNYEDLDSDNSSDTFRSNGNSEDSSNGTDILNAPEEIDWRTKNAVTPVKDQGKCGSCWAFSTVGVMESLKFRQDKKLVGISEQHLVDCDTKGNNKGCNGGLMDRAFEFIKKNGGISTESCYKYTGKQGKCNYKSSCKATTVANMVRIKKGDENDLKKIVGTIGPVAIAFDVSGPFSKYKSGVYNNPQCSASKIGHAMLAVGYGKDSKQGDYWLIKNSWGTKWGEKGYVKTARNKSNHCGITTASSYAT